MASVPSTPIREGWHEILHKGKLLGREPSLLHWKWGFRITSMTLALLFAWAKRFAMNVDGISYLDMAYAYMRADWKMAINPYWGAGYSWILGAVLTAFHVPRYWESTVVQAVNVVVFGVALIAFEYFLSGVIQLRSHLWCDGPGQSPLSEPSWWVLGYLLFMLVNLFISPLTIVTPDLCVEAVMLFASGIVVRVAAGWDDARAYAALGVILSAGYLIKSPMFPMGLTYLGILWVARPSDRRVHRAVAMALMLFLLISGPYILAISRAAGRFTIGENARITYAEYIFGDSWWRGQIPGTGNSRHKWRKLMESPEVFEFPTSTGGTLPPYYNPAYGAEGLEVHMDLHGQLRVLRDSAGVLWSIIYGIRGEYVVLLLVLFFLQGSIHGFLLRLVAGWPIWLPGLVAVVMYIPVHIEPRFLSAPILLIWAGLTFALELPNTLLTHRLFHAVALALLVMVGYRFLNEGMQQLRQPVPPVQWTVAQYLMQHGLRPGDRVAQMLFPTRDAHYWAHLAGVTIVSEVPYEDKQRFWAASPEGQRRVEDLLRETGAKVLVTEDPPLLLALGLGWQLIPQTDYAVISLTRTHR